MCSWVNNNSPNFTIIIMGTLARPCHRCLCIHLRLQQLHILLWHWGWTCTAAAWLRHEACWSVLAQFSFSHLPWFCTIFWFQMPRFLSTYHNTWIDTGNHAHASEIHSSTVLAQDHFFSDCLSLHLTSKTHKVSMRMVLHGVGFKTSCSATAADLMNTRSPPLLNGLFILSDCLLTYVHMSL